MIRVFKHPLGEDAATKLSNAIKSCLPGHIIALIGIGGTGKSTVVARVCREMFGQQSMWRGNVTPVARVMAVLPDKAFFSSLAFVTSIKKQVMFPDIRWLDQGDATASNDWIADLDSEIQRAMRVIPATRKATEREEWAYAADLVRSKGVELLIVEHANALLRNHRDTTPAQHLQNLMSWGEAAGVRILLVGVETLPDLWHASSELSRRVAKIWLCPYTTDTEEGTRIFASVMSNMLRDYEHEKDILRRVKMIHDATGGIIGQLRRLLEDASMHGSACISVASVRHSVQPADAIQNIWASVTTFDRVRCPADDSALKKAKAQGIALGRPL